MKTYEEFKEMYTNYMKENNKTVEEKDIKKNYKFYKQHTDEYSEDDIMLEQISVRPKINIKISLVLKEIIELRELKKSGKNVKEDLKSKLRVLKELRLEKKSK